MSKKETEYDRYARMRKLEREAEALKRRNDSDGSEASRSVKTRSYGGEFNKKDKFKGRNDIEDTELEYV